MKRLTVDQTWEQCLAMWKWISRQCLGKDAVWCFDNVPNLKRQWLRKHGIKPDEISSDCFFCDRTTPKGRDGHDCLKCQGMKINLKFNCCEPEYYYSEKPRLFYAELKRLNKIRLNS